MRSCRKFCSQSHHIPGFGSFTGPVGPSSQSQSWVNASALVNGAEFDVIVIGGGHAGTWKLK